MQTVLGAVFCAALIVLVIITGKMRRKAVQKVFEQYREKDFSYTLVFGGYDWGPGIEKIILNVGPDAGNFTEEDLEPEKFTVMVKSEGNDSDGNLPVKRACLCDIDGNEIMKSEDEDAESVPDSEAQAASHIALEIEPERENPLTAPFVYDETGTGMRWKKTYDFTVSHPRFEKSMTECSDWFSPDAQKFREIKTDAGITAFAFSPDNEKDGARHPVIVCRLGGKCSGDVALTVLENNMTPLVKEKVQSWFGGAFIVCVQGESVSAEQTKKITDQFIKKHPAADKADIRSVDFSEGAESVGKWISEEVKND